MQAGQVDGYRDGRAAERERAGRYLESMVEYLESMVSEQGSQRLACVAAGCGAGHPGLERATAAELAYRDALRVVSGGLDLMLEVPADRADADAECYRTSRVSAPAECMNANHGFFIRNGVPCDCVSR